MIQSSLVVEGCFTYGMAGLADIYVCVRVCVCTYIYPPVSEPESINESIVVGDNINALHKQKE